MYTRKTLLTAPFLFISYQHIYILNSLDVYIRFRCKSNKKKRYKLFYNINVFNFHQLYNFTYMLVIPFLSSCTCMLTTDTVILSHGGLMMMIVTINSYKRKQLSSILNRIHNTSNAIIIIIMEHKINIQRLLWVCVGLFELVSVFMCAPICCINITFNGGCCKWCLSI